MVYFLISCDAKAHDMPEACDAAMYMLLLGVSRSPLTKQIVLGT